jgi:hypothetical protein
VLGERAVIPIETPYPRAVLGPADMSDPLAADCNEVLGGKYAHCLVIDSNIVGI